MKRIVAAEKKTPVQGKYIYNCFSQFCANMPKSAKSTVPSGDRADDEPIYKPGEIKGSTNRI